MDKDSKKVNSPLEKKVVIKMPYQMWEDLRRISFESHISMAQLIREGAFYMINKNQKLLKPKT